MSEFYRSSKTWVVDFQFDGRARRWFKPFAAGVDVAAEMGPLLRQWYGQRARLVSVREATPDEETQYLRGEEPRNVYCPTGRGPTGRGPTGATEP